MLSQDPEDSHIPMHFFPRILGLKSVGLRGNWTGRRWENGEFRFTSMGLGNDELLQLIQVVLLQIALYDVGVRYSNLPDRLING